MHTQPIITKILNEALVQIHGARRESLYAAVSSALSGQALSVTALGRRLDSGVDEKHQIKRVKRLLSNRHLQRERMSIYQALARQMVGRRLRPVIGQISMAPNATFCCVHHCLSMVVR